MRSIKKINIKDRTYYFIDDIINITDFDVNLLKIDKTLYKNIDIYHIVHVTIKDFYYFKINSVNFLHLIVDKVDGYIEENNGNKYLIFASTDKDNEALTKYIKHWDGIKYLIKKINCGKTGD